MILQGFRCRNGLSWTRFQRGLLAPRLKTIHLEWATFQIMRRTHASLSRQAWTEPKLVADQLGHGLGVNLDAYTVAAPHRRHCAAGTMESALARRAPDCQSAPEA